MAGRIEGAGRERANAQTGRLDRSSAYTESRPGMSMPHPTDDPRLIIERAMREASGPDFGTVSSAAEHVYDSLCEAGLLTTHEVVAAIRAATTATSDPRWTPELVVDLALVIDAESSDWILNAPREPNNDPAWRMDVRTARTVLGYLADRGLLRTGAP